ncbi:ribonuclease H-like domain-containing protein [Xylariaceae sp. FL0594]|nr:ribonuclease H-like domain-containing protein [Xylariaceae sp. FL0594]
MKTSPGLVLYRYDLSVKPEATGRKLKQIVRLLLDSPELASAKEDVVTDFKSTLISRKKITDQTIRIRYRSEGEDEPSDKATDYDVKLLYTNTCSADDLVQHLTSTNLSNQYDQKLPMIQAFNIFLNHYSKSADTLTTIGANKTFLISSITDRSSSYSLGDCLTAVRGYFASVRAATGRILVNVNVSNGAFYQAGPLEDFILGFDQSKGLRQFELLVKKLRIRTTHLKERKNKSGAVIIRPKTIIGIANTEDGKKLEHPPRVKMHGAGPKDVEFWLEERPAGSSQPSSSAAAAAAGGGKKKKGGKAALPPPSSSSSSAKGQYISVYDFFLKTHNIRITNERLPVMNVGTRENPSYLPPQVCVVLPSQPAKTKLDPMQTAKMIRFAVRPPAENADSIVSQGHGVAGLSAQTNPKLAQFGVAVSSSLITVQGRLLMEPRVFYLQNKPAFMVGGGWNMVPRNQPSLRFRTGSTITRWRCLFIDTYRGRRPFSPTEITALMNHFQGVLRETGINATPPGPTQDVVMKHEDDAVLENYFQLAERDKTQLLFVILPHAPTPLYNRIKQLGDIKYGIHTVCSVGSKILKNGQFNDQYMRNVALKINLKFGGNNHIVDANNLGFLTEDKTMIVGIDVTHPSPGSTSAAPSVAGMVASVNAQLGQWPGVLNIQAKSRQEMVSDLKGMLISRLRLWRSKGGHGAYPENILIYRDGVSEGQYATVEKDELPQIRAACADLYSPADQKKGLPKITLIIVGKRHHTRFYPTNLQDADRSGNSKPGTVVDRGVTEARSWDFYLQAHAALQGTARPAHYFVLLDEIFRSRYGKAPGKNVADELQMTTQSLCYLFGRATKSVSYCTPAYYADILCERARNYLAHVFDSPSGSVATSATSGPEGANRDDVKINESIKDSMFYI